MATRDAAVEYLTTKIGEKGQFDRACNKTPTPAAQLRSLQLRILRLGFLQDGGIGVGVLAIVVARHLLVNVA